MEKINLIRFKNRKHMKKIFYILLLFVSSSSFTQDWGIMGGLNGETINASFASMFTLAMSGDGIVICGGINRVEEDDLGNNRERVPIYRWNGVSWEEQFAIDGYESLFYYGTSYADQYRFNYNGEVLAIIRRRTAVCSTCPSIKIYQLNHLTNRYESKGNPINTTVLNGGFALSDDGNSMLTSAGGSGALVFDFNGTDWVQRGLVIDDVNVDSFGAFANITPDGNNVVIGSHNADTYGLDAGVVNVYSWDGSSWQPKGSDIAGIIEGDKFGCHVDISEDGNTLISYSAAETNTNQRGHVRIFKWDGSTWLPKGQELQVFPLGSGFSGTGYCEMDNSGDTITVMDYQMNPSQKIEVYAWDGISSWTTFSDPIEIALNNEFTSKHVLSSNGKRVLAGIRYPGQNFTTPRSLVVYSMECFPSYDTITEIACASYTWSVNANTYTNSGMYSDTLLDIRGCDSIVTLNLTINAPAFMNFNETACDSYTWDVDGASYTYTNSGTYTHIGSTQEGCVYTYTLDLIVNNSSSETINETACDSYTWDANGTSYNSSGTYINQSTNAAGCTHTSTLNLVINNSTNESLVESACESYFWDLTGITYTTNTTTSHFSTNVAGCPHETSLFLVISQPTEEFSSITACDSYTWPLTGETFTSTGSYTHTDNNGVCPAIYNLDLTVNTIDATTTLSGTIISANENGATYQWIDCDNGNTPIAGETNQSFTASISGNYAVSVSKNNCTEISDCVNLSIVGLDEKKQAKIDLFPNPTDGSVKINLGTVYPFAKIKVYNTVGQLISTKIFESTAEITLEIDGTAGVYMLEIETTEVSKSRILVVKK